MRIWQIDAFTNRPFAGNPAAVCVVEQFPEDGWMQSVAAEMNLAETAFIQPLAGQNRFHIRWFTPAFEVDLCGHATLASAHLLWQEGLASSEREITFASASGELVCSRAATGITLDFPATPPSPVTDAQQSDSLLSALRISQGEVFQSRFDLLVVLPEEQQVIEASPDFLALNEIPIRGVIISAASQQAGTDFVSRFFAPRCNINEDPVTGSAHCCLAPYWSQQTGRPELVGYQASPRGGFVHCRVAGDRVKLTGEAVTVLAGKLLIPISA